MVTINLTSTQSERPRIVKPFDESTLANVESELVIDLDTMLAHMPQDTDGVKYNIIESDDERFDTPVTVKLGDKRYFDITSGSEIFDTVQLGGYGMKILKAE